MVSLKEKLQAVKEGKGEPPPIAKTLGMNLVQLGEGKASFTLLVDKRFHNPMGSLHGGIMTNLADASMGVALMSLLGDRESFTTLELRLISFVQFMRGELRADAKVLHRGRRWCCVPKKTKKRLRQN